NGRVGKDDVVVVGTADVEHGRSHGEALILERTTFHQEARQRRGGGLSRPRHCLNAVHRVLQPLARSRGRRGGARRRRDGGGDGGGGGGGGGSGNDWRNGEHARRRASHRRAGQWGRGRRRFSGRPRLRAGW